MKKLFSILICFVSAVNSYSQYWLPLSTGCGINDSANGVSTLDTFNGQLIAAGIFTTAGGVPVNNIASWNGSNWDSLGGGIIGGTHAEVDAMVEYNGELYVGGISLSSAGGVPISNIAKWDGISWSSVGTGINASGLIQSMCVYNNELYVAGHIDTAGGVPVNNIARWNGTTWDSVAGGISGGSWPYGGISALIVYNNKLYAGGSFQGNVYPDIAVWDGTTWASVGYGIGGSNPIWSADITSMCVFNGNLYVSGSFDTAGTSPSEGFAYWNDTTWNGEVNNVPLGSEDGTYSSYAMTIFNNGLIGQYKNEDFGIAQFNGTSWSNILGGISNFIPLHTYPGYSSLCVWNGNLYVGGWFTDTVSLSNILNIAEYSTSTGLITIGLSNQINIYPVPVSNQLNIANIEPNNPVIITNLLGQEIMRQTVEANQISIDVSSLSPGLYFMNKMKFVKE